MFRRWRRHAPSPSQSNGYYRHGNGHLIELRQVVKTYQTAAGPFVALRGVDLQIDNGEFVAIVGKSGSGKSTLINMLTGIDRPSQGEVLVGDTAVHTLTEGQIAVWRGHNVGVIFQFFQLLPTLTVIENVMLPMDFCNMYTPRQRRERAMLLLDQVELRDQAHKLPTAISGGQQQRAAIARALANDPPILVADEPTGNLDSRTADAVFHLFETLVASGKTVVMVTHDTDLAQRAGRAVVVADGQILNGGQASGAGVQGAGKQGKMWKLPPAKLQSANLPTVEPVTGATQPLSLDEQPANVLTFQRSNPSAPEAHNA
jgi:putative ABC transport system ATP-binding protein